MDDIEPESERVPQYVPVIAPRLIYIPVTIVVRYERREVIETEGEEVE